MCACVGGDASVWKPPKKPRARSSRCVSRSVLGLVPNPRRLLQPPVPVGKVACGFVVRDSNSLSAPVSSLLRTDRCSRLSLLSLPGSCRSVVSVAKPPKTLRARSSRCVFPDGFGCGVRPTSPALAPVPPGRLVASSCVARRSTLLTAPVCSHCCARAGVLACCCCSSSGADTALRPCRNHRRRSVRVLLGAFPGLVWDRCPIRVVRLSP